MRIGPRQAERLLQLSAGYVVMSGKDPYTALRAKGLVEDRSTSMRGSVEYERKNHIEFPCLTREGHAALREYVQKNGRLEIEMLTPLTDFSTVIRMDPADASNGERQA